MTGIEDRIAAVLQQHEREDDYCKCGLFVWIEGPEHAAHVAAAVVAELGLTREKYVTQDLGVSPMSLHNWERWATAWEKES